MKENVALIDGEWLVDGGRGGVLFCADKNSRRGLCLIRGRCGSMNMLDVVGVYDRKLSSHTLGLRHSTPTPLAFISIWLPRRLRCFYDLRMDIITHTFPLA